MKTIYAIFVFLLTVTAASADDLWVPPKGTLHSTFSFTGAQWDQFLQRDSQSVELPGEISQYELAIYTEYSPFPRWSFDLLVPITVVQKKFVYLQTDPYGDILGVQTGANGEIRDVDTNRGIGDVVLGSKYTFLEKGLNLTGRLHLKIPGTYDYGEVVNAPGDGQTDVGLSLLAGMNFPQARLYTRGSLSLVFRAKEPANQIEFMLEPGFFITSRFTARLLYQHIEQLGGEDIQYYDIPNYYPALEEDADRIGAGLSYKANDTVGFYGLFQATVAGKNTANTMAITFGLDITY